MLLDVSGLDVRYGRTLAVSQLSLRVAAGEIVAVLGANGAGKSSLLKTLQGVVRPSSGDIVFGGTSIVAERPDQRIRRGLVLVPEGRQILINLTIRENLLLGAYTRRNRAGVDAEIDEIYRRFPNLAERRDMAASCLSGGEQQMLAIGRALLARPRLMMLDEPSLGLSPLFVDNLFALIAALNRDGLSILLVEQNIDRALKIARRGYVLELGKLVLVGTAAELLQDPALQGAYLGGGAAEEGGSNGCQRKETSQ